MTLIIYLLSSVALLIGFIGIVVPFAAAIPLIWIFGDSTYTSISNKGVYFLFLGVLLGISALPVLARILAGHYFS
jgi:uncharacterized protein YqgC (DUF456 family)